jgi:branched-chain amino acid aminotransferase
MAKFSETWTWIDGEWHSGNPGIMGPRTHASWLSSSVFDGGRVFDGFMPDMDLHAARVNDSAVRFGLKPLMKAEEIVALTREGTKKFGRRADLYVKPMYWAEVDGHLTR